MSSYLSSLFLEPVFRQGRLSPRRDRTASPTGSATNREQSSSADRPPSPLSRAGSDDDNVDLLDPAEEEPWERNPIRARTIPVEPATGQQLLPSPLQNLDDRPPTENSRLSNRTSQLEGSRALTFGETLRLGNEASGFSQNPTNDNPAAGETMLRGDPRNESEANLPTNRTTTEQSRYAGVEEYDWGDKSPARLPADDGMSRLRRRIHAIRDTESSNSEKARLIHELMTEEYNSSQPGPGNSLPLGALSPASLQSPERPWTPASPQSRYSSDHPSLTPASTASIALIDDPYYLRPEDTKPSYVPVGETADEEFEPRLGCQHYKRNVKLQCFTCKKWYPCRFCHDAAENHSLDRKKTENMLCMLCACPQAAAEWCKRCGKLAAWYYCSICKLWDDDNEKSIYHCNDCGICRIGQGLGKDFFHCKTCCVCMPMSIETTHKCIERSTQCDCPICGEYMFTSPETVVFMRCGHSIHHKCFSEYSKTSYRCPICSKSIANMETHFRSLDRTIESQPMPPEFTDTKALIYCNDCSAKSAVPYHWLGLKCEICESYNTAQIHLFSRDEAEQEDASILSNSRAIPMARPRQPPDTIAENDPTEPEIHSRSVPATEGYLRARPITPARGSNRRSSYSTPYRNNPLSLSPVVGNYFGFQRQRDSDRPTSSTIEEHPERNDEDRDHPDFWGRSRSESKTGFFGDRLSLTDEDMDEDDDEYDDDDEEEILDDDDGEDEGDSIEIFGHR
ncbi:hypothetical protein FQN54_002196 [Arachnomyces sp. PD_36]|nr:hypothetical protein FQN54_002196 [Arachnomyces sp. PD_36]